MGNKETKEKNRQERIGEESTTKYGTKAIIVDYINTKHVVVEFQDKYRYRYTTSYTNFKNHQLTNPYDCRNGGIGFIGVGKYNSKDHKLAYHKWKAMLERCTAEAEKLRYSEKSYKDCLVCEEWLNFQKFAEWFYSELYDIDGEPICIDKDILYHDNQLYSPSTCLLVPQRINLLFIKEKARRGNTIIGSYYHKDRGKYLCSLSTSENGKKEKIFLGFFDNEIDAFYVYKYAKEKYIKELADRYKYIIPKKVYDALYQYEVLITD